MATIPIIVEAPESTSTQDDDDPYLDYSTLSGGTERGIRRDDGRAHATDVDVGKLRQSFAKLSGVISEVLQDVQRVGDYQLTQVELQVEVTAEGGVNLIGTMKAGTKGAISLTFEPPPEGGSAQGDTGEPENG